MVGSSCTRTQAVTGERPLPSSLDGPAEHQGRKWTQTPGLLPQMCDSGLEAWEKPITRWTVSRILEPEQKAMLEGLLCSTLELTVTPGSLESSQNHKEDNQLTRTKWYTFATTNVREKSVWFRGVNHAKFIVKSQNEVYTFPKTCDWTKPKSFSPLGLKSVLSEFKYKKCKDVYLS